MKRREAGGLGGRRDWPPLILASASPRRREMMKAAGLSFRVVESGVREIELDCLTGGEQCRINAYRKARPVAVRFPDALVIGADTLVALGGKVFGKPKDAAEAERMLAALSGRTHHVTTAVCFLCWSRGFSRQFAEVTAVTFRRLAKSEVARYLAQVDPRDKAGGYGIQEQGEILVRRVRGSSANVAGLPMERLLFELGRFLDA